MKFVELLDHYKKGEAVTGKFVRFEAPYPAADGQFHYLEQLQR